VDYQVVALLNSFNAEATAGVPVKVTIESTGLYTNNTAQFAVRRSESNHIVYRVQFVIILINHAERKNNHAIAGYYSFSADNATRLAAPTQFGIDSLFSNSVSGGFDGNCVIGIMWLTIAGNTTGYYNRSAMFDVHTSPFSSVENQIYDIGPGIPEYYFCSWRVLCLAPCPPTTFYSS
jgi:hypothetical protein